MKKEEFLEQCKENISKIYSILGNNQKRYDVDVIKRTSNLLSALYKEEVTTPKAFLSIIISKIGILCEDEDNRDSIEEIAVYAIAMLAHSRIEQAKYVNKYLNR